ncbi:hypothetical protein EDD92_7294 [Streptomyces sp. TLI_185]|nr:hypothetical protein EDD92_7294 [Streptomyces sp. TLI_185]
MGGGWASAGSLTEGGVGLDTFLARDDAQVLRDYGVRARPDVVASFGLHRHAWPACLLITVPCFLHRRVPRLPVGHVSYDRTVPGLPIGRMAMQPAGFACLPGDPAAALPGARVADGEEARRGGGGAGRSGRACGAMRAPSARAKPRVEKTDEVMEGLWYVAQLLDEGPRACANWRRCRRGPPSRTPGLRPSGD